MLGPSEPWGIILGWRSTRRLHGSRLEELLLVGVVELEPVRVGEVGHRELRLVHLRVAETERVGRALVSAPTPPDLAHSPRSGGSILFALERYGAQDLLKAAYSDEGVDDSHD